ncbi:MAG: hypothetical protein F6K28_39160 [Microcoleus sp. SIO2G3]|nr:hypothetical protein [Microcoleus sp. SIO2G3]
MVNSSVNASVGSSGISIEIGINDKTKNKGGTANKEQMNNNQADSVNNARHADDQSSTLVNVNQ